MDESDVQLAEAILEGRRRSREPWMFDAECLGKGTHYFFLERGASVRPGKAMCGRCPVIQQCDDYQRRTQSEGMWAGRVRDPRTQSKSAIQDARPRRVS